MLTASGQGPHTRSGEAPRPCRRAPGQALAPQPQGAAAAAQRGHLLRVHGAWRGPAQKHHGHLSILLQKTGAQRWFRGPQLLSKIWGQAFWGGAGLGAEVSQGVGDGVGVGEGALARHSRGPRFAN